MLRVHIFLVFKKSMTIVGGLGQLIATILSSSNLGLSNSTSADPIVTEVLSYCVVV